MVLKRILRYLRDRPRLVLTYQWQQMPDGLSLLTDSDWATCPRTRRSKSGGVIYHGLHPLVWWCKLQDRVAPSSAIAELKPACKGYAELLLLKHVRDFMEDTSTSLQSHAIDASAAKGIILRQGVGPVKYLSVRQLWIQEAVKDDGIQVYKIDREENTADFMCSPGKESELEERLAELAASALRPSS